MASLKNIRVSGRYATALFDLAVETDQIDRVKKDIELVSEVVGASRELLLVFRNPMINVQKKMAILDDLFRSNVSELTLSFLKLITRKKRIVCLHSISETFLSMVDRFKGIKTVYVETAAGLDDDLKNKLLKLMSEHTKNSIKLIPEVKPYLVGGFRLRFDDYIYDASLRHKLVLLRKEFERNIYKRKF
jgi:F-type H+-transporting ATPase subunit delta